MTTTANAPVLINLFPWDFPKGHVFAYGKVSYRVDKTTRAKVYVTSLEDFKTYTIPFTSLNRVKKEDIKPATPAQLEALDNALPKADPRILLGAPVTITDAKLAAKLGFTTSTRLVVIKDADDVKNVVQLGVDNKRQYWRIQATHLAFLELA